MNLQELKTEVLADSVIDTSEVKKIREVLLADGVIDKEEADFLFELNDKVTGGDNSPAWPVFFSNALSAYVLHDETSPGVVDAEEVAYLEEKILGDGQVDATEKALLNTIVTCAESVDATWTEKFGQYIQ